MNGWGSTVSLYEVLHERARVTVRVYASRVIARLNAGGCDSVVACVHAGQVCLRE